MIELIKYFRVLFLSPKISRSRLKDFCENHIARLTANNPGGIFTTILTDVTATYTGYFGDLSSEVTNLAVQQGKTIAMNAARANLEKLLSKDEKLIAYKYSNAPETYEEFYPGGITEYNNADLPTLETIGTRFKNILAAHSADFDAAVVTEYNSILQTFIDNRTAQTTAMGNVSAERSDMATTKPALCKQLTVNLLTIALKYVDNESKCEVYFDQSILNAAFKEAENKVDNDINDGETQNVFDNTSSPATEYKITVSGDGSLFVGFAENELTPITALTGKTVGTGTTPTFSAAELGFTVGIKTFLNVTNASGITLSYVIERV